MSTRLAVIDRLTILIVGLVLLVLGLIPAALYFDVPGVSKWARSINRLQLALIPATDWYIWALVALATVLVVIGVSMVATNLRSRNFSKREITGESDAGTTTVHFAKLAQAIGTYLANDEAINKVDTTVSMVGNRPTVTFTLEADPAGQIRPIIALVESVEADLRDAVEEMDLDTVYKLHLSRVEP